MKKILKVIGIVILALIVFLVISTVRDHMLRAADQKDMVKSDDELIGEQFYVPREGQEAVDTNIYIPQTAEKLPLIVNLHGGAFIAGDADTLDTQSDRLSKNWNAVVVTVNYKLAKGDITIEYGTTEVVDTVKYFIDHADEYHIDANRIVMLGYSAGGYHAMLATALLKQAGIDVKAQVLCYSFISNIVDVYNGLSQEQKETLAPALFILADGDPISDGSLEYEAVLKENGVLTEVKKYEGSMHGFIEENNPEYDNLRIVTSKSPEQDQMARAAEDYIFHWLTNVLRISAHWAIPKAAWGLQIL